MNSLDSSTATLALACIVKNEAQQLGRLLDSVSGHIEQLVVVDTGSDDETVAIAQSYGATVEHFEWCEDFSAARNYSLSFAKTDWILILDADEELIIQDPEWRAQLTADHTQFVMTRHDIHEAGNVAGGQHLRLFRNVPGLRYEGRYHEQLIFPNTSDATIDWLEGVAINHYGNSDENLHFKNVNRDIPILELMREEKNIDLWRLDCLARKYIKVGNEDQADDCYMEALDRITPNLLDGECPLPRFWIPNLLEALGTRALDTEDFETARYICMRGLEWFPTFPPLNYLTGELMLNLGFPLAAIGYFEYCLALGKTQTYYKGDPFPLDFVEVIPSYGLGLAYSKMGDREAAVKSLERALSWKSDFQPALDLLAELNLAS